MFRRKVTLFGLCCSACAHDNVFVASQMAAMHCELGNYRHATVVAKEGLQFVSALLTGLTYVRHCRMALHVDELVYKATYADTFIKILLFVSLGMAELEVGDHYQAEMTLGEVRICVTTMSWKWSSFGSSQLRATESCHPCSDRRSQALAFCQRKEFAGSKLVAAKRGLLSVLLADANMSRGNVQGALSLLASLEQTALDVEGRVRFWLVRSKAHFKAEQVAVALDALRECQAQLDSAPPGHVVTLRQQALNLARQLAGVLPVPTAPSGVQSGAPTIATPSKTPAQLEQERLENAAFEAQWHKLLEEEAARRLQAKTKKAMLRERLREEQREKKRLAHEREMELRRRTQETLEQQRRDKEAEQARLAEEERIAAEARRKQREETEARNRAVREANKLLAEQQQKEADARRDADAKARNLAEMVAAQKEEQRRKEQEQFRFLKKQEKLRQEGLRAQQREVESRERAEQEELARALALSKKQQEAEEFERARRKAVEDARMAEEERIMQERERQLQERAARMAADRESALRPQSQADRERQLQANQTHKALEREAALREVNAARRKLEAGAATRSVAIDHVAAASRNKGAIPCRLFIKTGSCNKQGCQFAHEGPAATSRPKPSLVASLSAPTKAAAVSEPAPAHTVSAPSTAGRGEKGAITAAAAEWTDAVPLSRAIPCRVFINTGSCPKPTCKFMHDAALVKVRAAAPQQPQEQDVYAVVASSSAPAPVGAAPGASVWWCV
jgi:hypothetical protein